MGKALDGVRILDFTHVQSGPTCTQLLAWFGADVIKVERAGAGDITREQLRDIPDVDSLYFTMLNHNKRSITLDTKSEQGKQVLEKLVKHCDVLVENFAPGALDRMGFTWERIQELNPRMIVASVKGFGPGPYEDCKVYENVAQCAGGSASTTGFDDGPPLVTGAQIGDSGTGLHLALGIVAALYQRKTTGRGQRVLAAMQDGVLNLCRVKLRDQQRLERTGVMKEYPQYPNGKFGSAVPRAANASGGGQPGTIVKCKGWETDPNAYLYFIAQAPVWKDDLQGDRQGGLDHRSEFRHARMRGCRGSRRCSQRSRHGPSPRPSSRPWSCSTSTTFRAARSCRWRSWRTSRRCARPAPSSKSIIRKRGKYLTVGNPIKMSDSPTEVTRSPLLGEHTDEVLAELGYAPAEVARCARKRSFDTRAARFARNSRMSACRQEAPFARFSIRPRLPAARR